MKVVKQSAELIAHTPEPELLIELAARMCYRSEDRIGDGTAARMISTLIARGHESPLEHASATLLVTTDRAIMAELTRHRLASFSVESTRYVRYDDEISVVEPTGMTTCGQHLWCAACEEAETAYRLSLAEGNAPETARSVLPLCLATSLVVTANLREWRHILKLRLATAAHPQMRELARLIRDALIVVAPTVFGEFAT